MKKLLLSLAVAFVFISAPTLAADKPATTKMEDSKGKKLSTTDDAKKKEAGAKDDKKKGTAASK